jgi:hypothetical protein
MNLEQLSLKLSELILAEEPDCAFTIIIHHKNDSVSQFGYGCERCLAEVLISAGKRGQKKPHNIIERTN